MPAGTTTADVDETDPQYPVNHTQTEGDDPTTVQAVGGEDTSLGNDGYAPNGTVSGHLYIDTNGDGVPCTIDLAPPPPVTAAPAPRSSAPAPQASSGGNGQCGGSLPPCYVM